MTSFPTANLHYYYSSRIKARGNTTSCTLLNLFLFTSVYLENNLLGCLKYVETRKKLVYRNWFKGTSTNKKIYMEVYFYTKPTRCTDVSNLFYLERHCTCFGQCFRPSSGVQDCTYNNRHLLNTAWHMPVAVRTVLNSWWWTETPSETCRVSFEIK